jgi:hypothetical protein
LGLKLKFLIRVHLCSSVVENSFPADTSSAGPRATNNRPDIQSHFRCSPLASQLLVIVLTVGNNQQAGTERAGTGRKQ